MPALPHPGPRQDWLTDLGRRFSATRSSLLARASILLLVALAARAIDIANPITYVDEQFYFVVARAMVHGALPYVDIWDRKPIGLFLLYLGPAAAGYPAGILIYHLLALAFVAATAMIIARIAERAGWAAGALPAAICYILYLNLAEGEGGQSPIFYNLPVALAAASILAAIQGRRSLVPAGCMAMALVGVALQIKYSAVFEGVFFGLWLCGAGWRRWRRLPPVAAFGALLITLALLPTAAALAFYVWRGHAGDFIYANFISILMRNRDPVREQLHNLRVTFELLAPFAAIAVFAWRKRDSEQRTAQAFLIAWFAAAVAGLLIFGGWYDHYSLPVMAPGCVLSACFFARLKWRRWSATALLGGLALIGHHMLIHDVRRRGTQAQFAALARAVGTGPGCLYVYSGQPMLYAATGRCTVTTRLFYSHLNTYREQGSVGVDQAAEIRRILARRPQEIVMEKMFRGEREQIREIMLAGLRRYYFPKAVVRLGKKDTTIFALRSERRS